MRADYSHPPALLRHLATIAARLPFPLRVPLACLGGALWAVYGLLQPAFERKLSAPVYEPVGHDAWLAHERARPMQEGPDWAREGGLPR